ncbi:uncharacterized acetyltransferase At3g50280 [Amborella trichopoda]|uniref:Uncharacterized protein n=1 Tax=Amborella trichopoda TaxID=13333 RepID=W1PPV4_AMBTC|nr:uncharacterized acetyltransferase At3g50280 [Amborella trichopoda]ERN12072.1 hypothetical protein AMTR_s00035p00187610 [Amborella trichopoda]|eukprot:XP_006850491.3 uncharacterized acetyltransferase At3g50280 [Amborella trichopoda]
MATATATTTTTEVSHVTTYTVKPARDTGGKRWHLGAPDLSMLSYHYIQKGLFFTKPPSPIDEVLDRLRAALSECLVHFFPLAGRLVYEEEEEYFYVDCNDEGAEVVHAKADVTAEDAMAPAPVGVTPILRDFFALNDKVGFDGMTLPLLAIQVTELVDGVFIGTSTNHALFDGTSYWMIVNALSELCRGAEKISRPPVSEQWFPYPVPIKLPFHPGLVDRFTPPPLKERVFHFSAASIAILKAKANATKDPDAPPFSSFQVLYAHLWRGVTRARKNPEGETVRCSLYVTYRQRVTPPMPANSIGNIIRSVYALTTAGELLSHNLAWAAGLLQKLISSQTDQESREGLAAQARNPHVTHLSSFGSTHLLMGSSPRFDMYGNDFGWGKPIQARVGHDNRYDGKAFALPAPEGGGSTEVELCLLPEYMDALEVDEEFLEAVTPS